MVPNSRFGFGSGIEPNRNRYNQFHLIKKLNGTEPMVFWPVPHFWKLTTLAPIKYFSSDWVTSWYRCKIPGSWCSFTSHAPNGGQINNCWVTVNKLPVIGVISQQQNEYWSDHTLESGSRQSIMNCLLYVYFILWYNQKSNP